ncbi:MAG: hypothetical protein WCL60_00590 [Methylococcales bacterium]
MNIFIALKRPVANVSNWPGAANVPLKYTHTGRCHLENFVYQWGSI